MASWPFVSTRMPRAVCKTHVATVKLNYFLAELVELIVLITVPLVHVEEYGIVPFCYDSMIIPRGVTSLLSTQSTWDSQSRDAFSCNVSTVLAGERVRGQDNGRKSAVDFYICRLRPYDGFPLVDKKCKGTSANDHVGCAVLLLFFESVFASC